MKNSFEFSKILLAIFILTCVNFFSCKSRSSTKDRHQIFSYNELNGIPTLDPAFAKNQSLMWIDHQIYNTLVEVDSNLNIVPSLAKSWDVSSDHKIYTFHLRNDVYFQDNELFYNGKGRLFKAKDAVYSLQRLLDPAVASSGAWVLNGRLAKDGLIALNDTTFQIRLVKPFHPILGILTMQYCSILPHEVVDKYGKDYRNHPCGTGPFQLKYWDEGQALILVKNPNYWERDSLHRRLPYLDGVKVSFFDNKATEFLQFRQGLLSFINDVDGTFKDEVLKKNGTLRKEWSAQIVLQKHPYLNIEYFGILVDDKNPLVAHSPLRLRKIRQAINFAIDRPKLVMYLRNSIGTPALSGFVPSGFPSENTKYVKGYSYQPQKALALLAEAGFPNGKGLPIIKLTTIPVYADYANFVARQLQDVGIRVQVETVLKSVLLEQTSEAQNPFFRGSWIADYPDAENYMADFYSQNPSPPNYTRYSNPDFDILYNRALQEDNDSIRYQLYRTMDQMVIDDAPVVPLFYDEAIHFLHPYVKGMEGNGLNLLELRHVYFDSTKAE